MLKIQWWGSVQFSSVHFSRSVVSDSLRPHESQHARPPCPSPTPGVHPDSRPSSQWCHPAISSSVIPFSSCPQSLPASESFPMSQLFSWGGQSTGVSALASFLPKKSQDWCPSEWTGWISLQSKGLSRVFSNTTVRIIESKWHLLCNSMQKISGITEVLQHWTFADYLDNDWTFAVLDVWNSVSIYFYEWAESWCLRLNLFPWSLCCCCCFLSFSYWP